MPVTSHNIGIIGVALALIIILLIWMGLIIGVFVLGQRSRTAGLTGKPWKRPKGGEHDD